MVDYFLGVAARECDLGSPEGKAEAVERVMPLLNAIQDPVLREGYLERSAAGLGLRMQTLEQALARRFRAPRRPAGGGEEAAGPETGQTALAEQNLLYILLTSDDRWTMIQEIDPDWFHDESPRQVFERIYEAERDIREGAEPPDDLFTLFEDETMRREVSRILLLPTQKFERFSGEVVDISQDLSSAFRTQSYLLHKRATQRRKQALHHSLLLIRNERPAGDGQLQQIEGLNREHIRLRERLIRPDA